MEVRVTGNIGEEEKQAYVRYALDTHPDREIAALDIAVDGEYADLTYHFTEQPRPFQRIRRITGYLVGDMSHWNNAKRAEEADRVKHSCC